MGLLTEERIDETVARIQKQEAGKGGGFSVMVYEQEDSTMCSRRVSALPCAALGVAEEREGRFKRSRSIAIRYAE